MEASVTAESPDLVSDSASLSSAVQKAAATASSVEDSFLLIAQLGCMDALTEPTEQLRDKIEIAIRERLLDACSISNAFSSCSLWLGFARFHSKLTDSVTPTTRDALLVEFILQRMSIGQLFESSMSWHRLRSLSSEHLKRTGDRFGGQAELNGLLESSYLSQRRALARELFLKSLPTLVLLVSSLIAIALALLFTRSLTTAQ